MSHGCQVSSKGLNTQSNNPQLPRRRCSASSLRDITAKIHTSLLPRFRPTVRCKSPTSCLSVLLCLRRLQYKWCLSRVKLQLWWNYCGRRTRYSSLLTSKLWVRMTSLLFLVVHLLLIYEPRASSLICPWAGRATTWRQRWRTVHGGEVVHGLGPWQKARPCLAAKPPAKDDKPALQSSAPCPTVTLALERSGPRSP